MIPNIGSGKYDTTFRDTYMIVLVEINPLNPELIINQQG